MSPKSGEANLIFEKAETWQYGLVKPDGLDDKNVLHTMMPEGNDT